NQIQPVLRPRRSATCARAVRSASVASTERLSAWAMLLRMVSSRLRCLSFSASVIPPTAHLRSAQTRELDRAVLHYTSHGALPGGLISYPPSGVLGPFAPGKAGAIKNAGGTCTCAQPYAILRHVGSRRP